MCRTANVKYFTNYLQIILTYICKCINYNHLYVHNLNNTKKKILFGTFFEIVFAIYSLTNRIENVINSSLFSPNFIE